MTTTVLAITSLTLSLLLCSNAFGANDSYTLNRSSYGHLQLDVTEEIASGGVIISPSGSSAAGCGSVANPCSTSYAVNNASPGDTLYMRGGTYTGAGNYVVDLRFVGSGTSSQPITLRNYPGEFPVLTGKPFTMINLGQDYWTIQGLTFYQGATPTSNPQGTSCLWLSNGGGGDGSNGWNIIGNHFVGCADVAIDCTDSFGHTAIFMDFYASNVLLDRNYFRDSGRVRDVSCDSISETNNHQYRHDHHLYLQGKYITVTNNVFADGAKAGVSIKLDGYSRNFPQLSAGEYSHVIVNNTFGAKTNPNPYSVDGWTDNVWSGAQIAPFTNNPSTSQYPSRWYVANNLFLDPGNTPGAVAIRLAFPSNTNGTSGNQCLNNIVQTPSQDAPTDYPGSKSGADAGMYFGVCSQLQPEVAANVTTSGNLIDQSLASFSMLDPANYDFRIQSGSVAENAGIDGVYTPSTDFFGTPRATPDVGAFEVK